MQGKVKQNKHSTYVVFAFSLFLLVLIFILSIFYGSVQIGFTDIMNAFLNKGDQRIIIIVREIRLPRAIVALIAGATLAGSGVLIKSVMRNPLADSGLLGIQSGASVVAMFVILVAGHLIEYLPISAFIGGIVAFSLIMTIAYKNGVNAIRMILAGVAVNAFFGAIMGLLTIYNREELQNALGWLNGSLANISINEMRTMIFYGVIALIIGAFLIPKCNLLHLDDDSLHNLGERVSLTRFLVSLGAVLLASVSVSIVGVIGFVGLVVPHIARLIIGTNHIKLYPLSLILGSILVLGADLFQKVLFSPLEMPVGIVISMLGTPFFLYLLRKEV